MSVQGRGAAATARRRPCLSACAKPANGVTTDFGVELAITSGVPKSNKEEPLIDRLEDSVPKPLGFSAFAPEWLTSGAAGRRPAIPAPGSALGSHPCVATILRPGEASIAGMPRLSHTNQKLLAAAATDAVQQRQVLAAVRWPVLK